MKLDKQTKDLIAKAICYGFERARLRYETAIPGADADPLCEREKEYARRYVHAEWKDWKTEVPHFLLCADETIQHPLG